MLREIILELMEIITGPRKDPDTPDPFKREAEIKHDIDERRNWKPARNKLFVSSKTKKDLGLD